MHMYDVSIKKRNLSMCMYDVSIKKRNLSMCMYDVIVKKAKWIRQKHKNMFKSIVLIVKRAKMRAIVHVWCRDVRGICTHAADAVR